MDPAAFELPEYVGTQITSPELPSADLLGNSSNHEMSNHRDKCMHGNQDDTELILPEMMCSDLDTIQTNSQTDESTPELSKDERYESSTLLEKNKATSQDCGASTEGNGLSQSHNLRVEYHFHHFGEKNDAEDLIPKPRIQNIAQDKSPNLSARVKVKSCNSGAMIKGSKLELGTRRKDLNPDYGMWSSKEPIKASARYTEDGGSSLAQSRSSNSLVSDQLQSQYQFYGHCWDQKGTLSSLYQIYHTITPQMFSG